MLPAGTLVDDCINTDMNRTTAIMLPTFPSAAMPLSQTPLVADQNYSRRLKLALYRNFVHRVFSHICDDAV
jgi:hypothetical protein